MSDNREFIEEFLVESTENLDQLDRDLIALEERPDDPQRLASIFRTIHTIKGTCGFLGFSKLEKVAHSGENLLGLLRDGKGSTWEGGMRVPGIAWMPGRILPAVSSEPARSSTGSCSARSWRWRGSSTTSGRTGLRLPPRTPSAVPPAFNAVGSLN